MGCGGKKAGVQVSRRELHTHIHLDYVRVEFLSCKKKKIHDAINKPVGFREPWAILHQKASSPPTYGLGRRLGS